MKDSGIEWIGEIPKEWKICRIKELFHEVNERCDDGSDYTLLSVSEYYGVAPRASKINDDDLLTHSETLDGYKVCHKHDIVMNIMLAWKGSLGLSEYVGIVSPAYCVYRANMEIDEKYFHYLFRTDLYTSLFKQFSTGIIDSRLRLYPDKFLSLKCQVPPLSDQHRIADYLDDKCGKIDRYIEQQKQVIEKLKAYKQSVITEAVTKGLDPTVPMKDSGVEWIGEIPEHWAIVKLGHIFSYLGGFAYNSNLYTDESDYQVVRIGNVKNYRLVLESNPVYISESTAKETSRYKLQSNTILFTMTGTKGKRDYFFTYLLTDNDVANKNLFLNQRVGCLIPTDDICPKYFDYLLKDNRILDSVFLYETGTANQGNLGIDSIKRTILQFPPVSEQRQIADFLDSKCSSIDAAIAEKQTLIDKLTEYKKSLIYEVVTGKKEV